MARTVITPDFHTWGLGWLVLGPPCPPCPPWQNGANFAIFLASTVIGVLFSCPLCTVAPRYLGFRTVWSGKSSSCTTKFCSRPTMQDLETLRSGGYQNAHLSKLKLTCPLEEFPREILELGDTLEQLDLSGTGLSALPSDIGAHLPNLKIAFFSQCAFTKFPAELASCPQLEIVAFRGNGMESIGEGSLPPRLRWLILTDNRLTSLPKSIGDCVRLQKCMLAGNRLRGLPDEMRKCTKLGLLRLGSNRLDELPEWLFEMPELAFLSFAGNPCSTPGTPASLVANAQNGNANESSQSSLAKVHWNDLEVHHTLGEGASGIISKGLWQTSEEMSEEVAIKLFKGALTSDGAPEDEMAAYISAGQHSNIIDALGRIEGHPEEIDGKFKGGLVMQLIPPHYQVLGKPPTLDSCTRDNYDPGTTMSVQNAMSILEGIAAAAQHLHDRGIAHGDLYAHNILHSADGHALLGDFGAATVHGGTCPPALEKLEVLAYAHLIEDILGLLDGASEPDHEAVVAKLERLHDKCSVGTVSARPSFEDILRDLESLDGGAGLERLRN